ncbi:hypothetical protein GQX73_g5575 [Xylaria multiplex]|uniref:PD-(D/E)XK nuclease-like domain-containing protein n=1 Tax=Xylaria multiplex TaxID=323545 RepID=A0A7C8ISG9_9PEZI|nr:hypothetical protein GQX73_g5575 [Xylaria multiplex]
MDPTVVLAWLTDVCSSAPSSIELPPSPSSLLLPPSRAHYQQKRSLRARQNEQRRTFNYPTIHQGRVARMPPRRRSPRKKVTAAAAEEKEPTDEPLRLGRISAALEQLDTPANAHAVSTNTTSQSRSLFSHKLSQATFSEPSNTDGPSLRSAVTGSSRARSLSPIKQANDLVKLDTPVYWRDISLVELNRRLEDHESAGLLKSIRGVLRKGYLPLELRHILDPELGLDYNDGDDMLYAETPSAPISEAQVRRARFLARAMPELSDPQQGEGSLSSLVHLQSLLSELEALETIVATTKDYSTVPRAEPSWNENVHSRMLKLAVSHTPNVGVENVTRANIAKDFLPPTSARHVSLPASSKLIDYAMVLKPLPTLRNEGHESSKKLSLERVVYFVDRLEYPSFNQSSYSPLCHMPSGIFIETKVNTQKSTEAKAQLGMWLASWYGRVSEFPDISDPPVLPILLVEAGYWELYFAFDTGSHYDVCGGVSIGSTDSLDEAYRLLAVLRILAKWMETDFLTWVEGCLQRAGV